MGIAEKHVPGVIDQQILRPVEIDHRFHYFLAIVADKEQRANPAQLAQA